MRGDKLQRYQAYALGMAGGWLCPDDARADEDMKPLPDDLGQTFMVPINSQSLEAAAAATAAMIQNPQPAAGASLNGNGGGNAND
jgi:hypothetical protein